MSTPEELADDYQKSVGKAERLRVALIDQIEQLLHSKSITLGVPIESRVKSLASILEKIERKAKSINSVLELDDIIGIRLILLFTRDVDLAKTLVESTFDIVSSENTADRLSEGQFGYQSQHYIVRLPKSWLSIPSFADLGDFRIELQVRTLAQHIWAAASHKLQYKHESSVPPPLRRTIHRVSALLETVDLEFERVLNQRREYISEDINLSNPSQPLNVDVLEAVLSELLPEKNKGENEAYANLLENLITLKVDTVEKLRSLLERHMTATAEADASSAERRVRERDYKGTSKERVDRGVFFKHVGWVRNSLRKEFGTDAIDALLKKPLSNEKKPSPSLKRTRTGKSAGAA
jgi:ppGpp synthetase/RelA/SpoT-type nucleotidyltranferase